MYRKTNLTGFIIYWTVAAGVLLVSIQGCEPKRPVDPPYGKSQLIAGIDLDWSTYLKKAIGSDNWPVTWAKDGHQYTSWGDGGGFGGSNKDGRVSLGIARIEGEYEDFKGINIWGGKNSNSHATFGGKSYGLLAIEDSMYMWVSPGSGARGYEHSRLYRSLDYGSSWNAADWVFDRSSFIVNPTFCQFGPGYQGSRDKYVYIYANEVSDSSVLEVQRAGKIHLMRVPKDSLFNKSKYEYFSGLSETLLPVWTTSMMNRKPVFIDRNGVGWNTSVSYNLALKRYLLISEHSESRHAFIGIFDAPEPWGPWSTVYYGKFPIPDEIDETIFFYNFSNKWLSEDGLDFTLIFTGNRDNDAWNSVRGRFTLKPD